MEKQFNEKQQLQIRECCKPAEFPTCPKGICTCKRFEKVHKDYIHPFRQSIKRIVRYRLPLNIDTNQLNELYSIGLEKLAIKFAKDNSFELPNNKSKDPKNYLIQIMINSKIDEIRKLKKVNPLQKELLVRFKRYMKNKSGI